ncbi:hypothetical protein ACXU4B_10795 [Dyella soli]|uniref:DUF2846 domain-containing protein n=1 Tax=Dyella soli TaxID=522319 RepID=A0A4R0YLZ1_9GAMM|nr:hypothetical protein [Dyella soli]TCI07335.1 hypothetical protein EZM97_32625 [Dyella soli]
MSRRKGWIAFVTVALLSGCAPLENTRPAEGYPDKQHPTSDTAIVACHSSQGYGCSINGVDHFKTGNAFWVRVLPGQHVLSVTIYRGTQLGGSVAQVVAVPGHVYEIRVNDMGKTFSLGTEDLGKRDSYTKRVGLEHFNATDFTAYF